MITGYSAATSIVAGEAVAIHVSTDRRLFDVVVLRDGTRPREMARIEGVRGCYHLTPPQAYACGCGWPRACNVITEAGWPSGPYRIRLVAHHGDDRSARATGDVDAHDLLLVVRARQPGATSPILLQLCTNTHHAYNNWGGHSLYAYNSVGALPGHILSFDRPGLGYHGDSTIHTWEMPFIRWADAQQIPLEFATNYDLEAHPRLLDAYRLMVSVGHDEYWSAAMRDSAEAFVDAGGHVAFFSGDCVCWRVRFERDGRAMRCHKDAVEDDFVYLTGDHGLLTCRWSDERLGRPENTLTGVCWNHGGYHRSHGLVMDGSGGYTVRRADHWVFEGTGVRDGDVIGTAATIVGYETDGCLFRLDDAGRPVPTGADGTSREFNILAQAPAARYAGHNGMATMGVHNRGRGLVFTAGTTDWAHGLATDPIVSRITLNVLRRLTGEV